MSFFTFTNEDIDGTTTTMEFEAVTWDEALLKFKQFLRGAGFVFDNEVLDDVFYTEDSDFDLDHLPASNWPFAPTEEEKCPCNHSACGVCGCC
jgi:hypothetical protein